MELSALNIPAEKVKQLNRAGITTIEELLEFFPRKYIDRSTLTGLRNGPEESVILFHAVSRHYRNTKPEIVVLKGYDCTTKTPVHILWFNQGYLFGQMADALDKDILVAGNAVWKPAAYQDPDRYEIASPAVFEPAGLKALGMYSVYPKVRGMAEEYLKKCLYDAASLSGPPAETIPPQLLQQHSLISHKEMVAGLHWPGSSAELEQAKRRQLWDDLLYFAMRIELNYQGVALGSPFNIPLLQLTRSVIQKLPFSLTADQDQIVQEIFAWIRTGRRVNALVQGDVGCGKTIIAFLLMIAFAENGYQAALMAPTQILAQQHHEGLLKLVAPLGWEVAFISGQKLRKAEQQALEEQIATGKYKLIVGTQALLSDTYQFKNLALVIEDEEHKYGVMQRQALTDKAAAGTHTVTMSATPIPRSLAQTIYGNNLQLYSVQTKPPGRMPVRTGIQPDMNPIYSYLLKEIRKNQHQAYVVCPMISANEKVEGVAAVEDIFEMYKKALSPYGVTVAMVTGKTKKTEAQQILHDFEENRISILVSTTVIEVGVNVPNATCIVIHSAERFGLAQLHQLRGRVGRGHGQSYCVLASDQKDNARLQAMCQTDSGFRIAEIDLQQRGAGDLLGSQQSGTEKHLAQALIHPEEYAAAQAAAKWIIQNGIDCKLLQKAVKDNIENKGGEMLGKECA